MRQATKLALRGGLGLLAVLMGVLIYLGALQLTGNFHAPIPGEMYRSAQLEPGDITRYAKQYGIRTVINLRGENHRSDWYNDEVRESRANGVGHIDFRMSAQRELTPNQVLALISIMREAPKPILIHCRAGADRTGLASAFYVAAIAKKGEWAAEKQLWMMYGHLPFWINSSYAMNRTFERMEPYLGFMDS